MKEFGQLLLGVGALTFLPSLVDQEWILSSWLGGMQVPIGLSAMAIGAALFGGAKLVEFRNSGPVPSPTSVAPRTDADPPAPATGDRDLASDQREA